MVVDVVLLQSVGAEALSSSCEPAAVRLAAALLGRMAASCRLMIAARLVAAEQPGEWAADLGRAKIRAPSDILPTDPQDLLPQRAATESAPGESKTRSGSICYSLMSEGRGQRTPVLCKCHLAQVRRGT